MTAHTQRTPSEPEAPTPGQGFRKKSMCIEVCIQLHDVGKGSDVAAPRVACMCEPGVMKGDRAPCR
jgi:hypothetical protein